MLSQTEVWRRFLGKSSEIGQTIRYSTNFGEFLGMYESRPCFLSSSHAEM